MRSQALLGILVLCFLGYYGEVRSQDLRVLDSLSTMEAIDSLLIDHDPSNYSLRLFGNFKSQRFRFKSDFNSIDYVPNNRSGVGIGFASNKLLVDIAINIKSSAKEPTERFDMRVNYKLRRHYFDFFFQRYKGFNLSDEQGLIESTFRNDIRSVATGLNYLYLFNEDKHHTGTLRTVISKESNTDFSYGLGGFMVLFDQKGDGNLLEKDPISNGEIEEIDDLSGYGLGVFSGIGGFFSLGSHLYSSLSLNAGIGLSHINVNHTYEEDSDNPFIYQLNAVGVLGYVRQKYYVNLSLEFGHYNTEIIKGIDEIINTAHAKLAFGYKIFK